MVHPLIYIAPINSKESLSAMRGRVYATVWRPSVCPSVRPSHLAAAGRGCGFAAVGPAARRYRSIAALPAGRRSRNAPVWRSGRLSSHRHTRHDKTVLSVSCLACRCELALRFISLRLQRSLSARRCRVTLCHHSHHPSPLHSFTPGLKLTFSANLSHHNLPFLLPE